MAKGGTFDLDFHENTQPDGTQLVTVTGTVPLGMQESLTVYKLSTPSILPRLYLAKPSRQGASLLPFLR